MGQSYLPHGVCYLWNPQLIGLSAISNVAIFLSYMAIAGALSWFACRERAKIPFSWLPVAFCAFIFFCGLTHAMDVVVTWKPSYWLAAYLTAITAVLSLATAAILPATVSRVRVVLAEARASRRSEARFLAASETMPDSFFILECFRQGGEIVDFRFAFVNTNAANLMSTSAEALVGKPLCEGFPVNVTGGFFEKYKRVVETGERIEEEFPIDVEAINASWLRMQVVKLEDGVAITTADISRQKAIELRLEKLAQSKKSIIASSPFMIVGTDLSGIITSVNPAAERTLGYSEEELLDRWTPALWLDPQELAARAATLGRTFQTTIEPGFDVLTANLERGLAEEAEWTFVRKDASRFDAHLTVTSLADDSGEIVGLILTAYDITERKREDRRIAFLAHHDELTGLPTRTLLQNRIQVALERAERSGDRVAVLMVDLDAFKLVNDRMGHHAGDRLLELVAERLQSSVGKADTVARIGGDEFVVVLDGVPDLAAAERIARVLLANLHAPIALGGECVTPTASIGLCLHRDPSDDGAALLKNADAAMYVAKAAGGNRCRTFVDGALPGLDAQQPESIAS
jgi:diguanylate cyclase (GGDEF)-like protein/PAS domain S-box-containing protein